MKSCWMPQAPSVRLSRSVCQPRRRRHWVRRGSMPTMLNGRRRFVDWCNRSRAVIICVEDGEGVLWEMTYLLGGGASYQDSLCPHS